MNTRLAFGSLAETPVDLLVVVLDAEKTLHDTQDPAVSAHLFRAQTGFRDKTLKREYFATLPEGAPAQALVVYWSPQPQELQPLGEREDVRGPRAAPGP